MTRRIIFSAEAQTDLLSLYDYIADQSGEARAIKPNCQSGVEIAP